MHDHRPSRFMGILAALPFALGAAPVQECTADPPCADTPDTMQGSFDGVVYDQDVGGQMYATQNDLCVNADGEVFYASSVDFLQTVVSVAHVQGVEMLVIVMSDWESPDQTDGGAEIVVLADSARTSARTGQPIPFDAYHAVGYYWSRGFWSGSDPDYVTTSGSITFVNATAVPQSPVSAWFSAGIGPYDLEVSSSRLDL